MEQVDSETVPRRHDGLQIAENRTFARVHWGAERVAWVAFLALVVAAGAGFTGSGGTYSRQVLATPSATLDLPAIARWQASETLSVRFDADRRVHQVTLGIGLLDYFSVERVVPAPESESFGEGGLTLSVVAPGGRADLTLRARRPGAADYAVTVDGASTAVRTLVLP